MHFPVRLFVFSVAFILLGAYGYLTLSGPQGIPALMDKRREIRKLEEENANLSRANEAKRERLTNFREKASEQNLEIRKKLRMLGKDETEFILPPPRQDAAKPEPAPQ